jgi:hypothetical protein
MFEHVGPRFYDTFFRRCAELLAEGGVMVLHSIGRSEGPNVTSPWITKYIFPGGYIPAVSEVMPAIERAGLLVCDIEVLRLHYAETLKAWRNRFMARREEAVQLYDERFARMWEFYLAASEMSFRKGNLMNFQIQLTRRQGVVPMTRSYVTREEARLRAAKQALRPRLKTAGEWRSVLRVVPGIRQTGSPQIIRTSDRNTRGASGGERNLLPARAAGMSVKVRACAGRKIPVKCELPHRDFVPLALWCCDAPQDQPADVRPEGRPPRRLCLDRARRRHCRDRAGLPAPDLRSRSK